MNPSPKVLYKIKQEKIIFDFRKQAFKIEYSSNKTGNCQFSTFAHQLQKIGIFRPLEALEKRITYYICKNPLSDVGFLLMAYVDDFDNWTYYMNNMAENGKFGDQQTLLATVNLFNVDIL